MKPVRLEALSDLKLVADGPLKFRAIHLGRVSSYDNYSVCFL